MIDTIIRSNSKANLDVQQAADWWETKMVDDYFTAYSWSLSAPHLYQRIPVNDTMHILELGCGYGRQLSVFCKMSKHVYGLDVSATAISLAREHVPQADVRVFDGVHVPFANESMDFVTSVFTMQHVKKSTARQLLKETMRVLKPDCYFLHEFIGGNWCAGKGKEHYSIAPDNTKIYNNGYTQEELQALCDALKIQVCWMEEKVMNPDGDTNIWVCGRK